jgi:type II secretory pathway component PulF
VPNHAEEESSFNVAALIGVVLTFMLSGAGLLVVPQFVSMFSELGIELPVPTMIAISPLTGCAAFAGLFVLFLLGLILPEYAGRREVTLVAFVAMACIVAFYIWALYIPMIATMEALD